MWNEKLISVKEDRAEKVNKFVLCVFCQVPHSRKISNRKPGKQKVEVLQPRGESKKVFSIAAATRNRMKK